jgi:uncharacterized protein (TIGR00369 family)|tara:strand:+ start:7 stop:435 length:429 start_codon:yes stop_codon:yes gene_type:complete
MTELPKFLPITMDNVNEAHNAMFAEWVKQLNIKYLEVTRGTVVADYTVADQEKFILGGVCGQVLMALMDTVFTVAVCTSDTLNKGTISQNNSFLRPAIGEKFIVKAQVKKFGKSITIGETEIINPANEKVICQSISTFSMQT